MGITAIQQLILFERHQFAECLFTILNGKYGLSGKFIHIIKLVNSIVHVDCKKVEMNLLDLTVQSSALCSG